MNPEDVLNIILASDDEYNKGVSYGYIIPTDLDTALDKEMRESIRQRLVELVEQING